MTSTSQNIIISPFFWVHDATATQPFNPPTAPQTVIPVDPWDIEDALITTPPTAPVMAPKPRKPKMSNKAYNYPILKLWPRLTKQPGEIGLEIECEGTNLFNHPLQFWTVHQDHSLRAHGDHPPIEYVLSVPIPRKEIPKALRYLNHKLSQSGSTVDDSQRTSVHVHINCQTMTMKQVYTYIGLYMIFEDILVEWSGKNRAGNLFCLRSKDAEYNIHMMEQALRLEDFNQLCNDDIRYMSCNMASLRKFGSLEFRSMRGTVDEKTILTWVRILTFLKDQSLKYKNPSDLVEDFASRGPLGFYQRIFSRAPELYPMFRDHPELTRAMWSGFRLFRDVALSIDWEDFDPEKEPKEILRSKTKIPGIVLLEGEREYGDEEGSWYYQGLTSETYMIVNRNQQAINAPKRVPTGLTSNTVLVPTMRKIILGYNGLVVSPNLSLTEEDLS